MKRQLKDMVVAITGASSGIGRTVAEQLASKGALLSLCARRVDRLEELNRQLGGQHLVMRADVSSRQECESFVHQTIAHFGRIDTVVCNAGFGAYKLTHEMDGDEIRRMFQTNVFGTIDVAQAAVAKMLTQKLRDGFRGQVMMVSSAAARRGVPYLGPYSATKAAQLSIAEAMRIELKSSRIAVTSVHPIMTTTEFGKVAESDSGTKLPRGNAFFTQTAEHVVRTMVRAIERPGREVWPHRPTRWALALGILMPRLADLAMKRYLQNVEEFNSEKHPPQTDTDPHR